jgi:zinc D-Ala-D-Ala carboxypeptidase
MTEVWRWKFFKREELACKCCKAHITVPESLDRLERLRVDFGKPMKVSSAYRCSKHNADVSTTGLDGPHTTGRAYDIIVSGKDAYDLVHLATLHGFTGIGINQRGDVDKRFIHIDDIKDRTTRPRIWSY